MSTITMTHVTPEEYLALEREAETKSSYIDGEILPMPGASEKHTLIMGNLVGELYTRLSGRGCRIYPSDLRVRVSETGMYTYPDVCVVAGKPQMLADGKNDNLLNPTVIIEVLSPSTEAFDRGRKWENYRQLASLREYLLVSQAEPLVERLLRDGEDWKRTEFRGLDAVVRFESLDCEVPLVKVYDQVFSAEVETPQGGRP